MSEPFLARFAQRRFQDRPETKVEYDFEKEILRGPENYEETGSIFTHARTDPTTDEADR